MGKIANAGSHHPDDPASDYVVKDWYNHPWDAVLRPTNKELAELSANMAIAAANNNNIIYIWGGNSYHRALEENNNDPSAITYQCGTDCMGTCFANIKGAMRRLGMDPSGIPDLSTSSADVLLNYGYEKFTDWDHIGTDAHAQRGDVYVNYVQHACMHVGDGNLDGYSTGGDSSSGGGKRVNLKVENTSPYILRIPEGDTSFDGDKFKDGQVCGVMLSAGYLYASGTHSKQTTYVARNLQKQVECAEKYNLPFALLAEVRARSVAEAKAECDKLYYVCAMAVPVMSLWLHLDFNNSKSVNDRILEYYIEECSKWGFKNTLGIYVTEEERKRISWDNYSERLYLWDVDHDADVNEYVGKLPFSKITSVGSSASSGSSGSGQDLANSNEKQQAIVNACKSTPSPGAGWCAAWVTYVYMNAGCGHPTGNACDMYYQYCKYSDRSQLKVGMIVAVPSHPGDSAGVTYGHVAIYIGNNQVMENVGNINTQSLDTWIAYFGKTHTPKWGFAGDGIA